MSKPQMEELASLHALDLLDPAERSKFLAALESDPDARRLAKEFDLIAATLAYDVPQVTPPARLKRQLLENLPVQKPARKIIAFPTWIPYAIAACFMALAAYQTREVQELKSKLQSTETKVARLSESNALLGLRLTALESVNASYVNSKVVVAWDAKGNRGIVSLQKLPPPTPGHDYQLWILDPQSAAPVSVGVIAAKTGESAFAAKPVSTATPGFAISLEPTGGSATPTAGAILFAVAPGA